MDTVEITCYTADGDLHNYTTGERIRRATPREVRASDDAGQTGAFRCEVSRRTVYARCPEWAARQDQR